MTAIFSGPLSQYGFLDNGYPSPFIINGTKWSSVDSYMNTVPNPNLDVAVTEKFLQNPHLRALLFRTENKRIIDDTDPTNRLGLLLMELRDSKLNKPQIPQEFDVVMRNLKSLLELKGYTRFSTPGSNAKLPINNLPNKTLKGYSIYNRDDKEATLDLFLDEPWPESRLQALNPAQNNKRHYYIIANLSRNNLGVILSKLSTYNNIFYFPLNEMFIEYRNHILTPKTYLVTEPQEVSILDPTKLPEISITDPLIRELGYQLGDIIGVQDFSPHYRTIVL